MDELQNIQNLIYEVSMFQLTNEEFLKLKENLIFQNGISN